MLIFANFKEYNVIKLTITGSHMLDFINFIIYYRYSGLTRLDLSKMLKIMKNGKKQQNMLNFAYFSQPLKILKYNIIYCI